MKRPIDLKFPYPFLSENGGDYRESSFIVTYDLSLSEDGKTLKIVPYLNIHCEFIQSLINSGDAIVAVHIEQRTYRSVKRLTNGVPIEIETNLLSPNFNIEIVAMIVCCREITFSYDPSMLEIYSYFDEPFKCGKGSIMGYSNFEEFALPTEERISSIFTISEYKDASLINSGGPFKIDLDANVINIMVMPDIKTGFATLREKYNTWNRMLNSVFVYPAIELAILETFRHYENYCNYKWCIAISNKIAEHFACSFESIRASKKDIDKDDLIEYTHIILEDLLTQSFKNVEEAD